MAIVSTRWPEAEAKLKYNLSSPTASNATAVAAGHIVGGDIFRTFDLEDGRVGILSGDWFCPSAPAQTRNQAVTANGLVRNALLIQTGYDLSTAAMATYHGGPDHATAYPFFAHRQVRGATYWRYPFGGLMLDGRRLLVVGMYCRAKLDAPNNLGTSMTGTWAMLFDGVDGAPPDQWTPRNVEPLLPLESFHGSNPVYVPPSNPIDGGDGYGYLPMSGPSRSDIWTVARFDLDRALRSDLRHLEWLHPGGRWKVDRPYRRAGQSAGAERARKQILGFSIEQHDQAGGIHRRPDGKWQFTCNPDLFPLQGEPASECDPHIKIAVADSVEDLFFDQLTDIEDIPTSAGRFYYGVYSCPEETWVGKPADGQVLILSHNQENAGLLFTDPREYQGEVRKLTGAP